MHIVYGSRISYYTGKLETYLRFRGIPYERRSPYPEAKRVLEGAGAIQHPTVELDDGRWLSDTTPMLAWFEQGQPAPSIYPDDPVLRFAALLIEDYADEWLWRPAMHYRWSYALDRDYAGALLADDELAHIKAPRVLKKWRVARRQLRGFVTGDGVDDATWDHVEQSYLTPLDRLQALLSERPFLLGERPTIADFGMMGPMFRHFGQDPTPEEIMRTRAPAVYEWTARMWNAKPAPAPLIETIDTHVAALLREACDTHLAQLRQNAAAVAQGLVRYDQVIQGCRYIQVPSSPYRVWCLEALRREWDALDDGARDTLRRHLPGSDAAVLWDGSEIGASGVDPEGRAPFAKGVNVFPGGVPRR